jgi:hypothetical protein
MKPADIAREQDEGLRLLFEAGLELALQVQADAMAAEPSERAGMALAFHRLSRGVRQTAALRMRLARDAERAGREASAEVVKLEARRAETRKGQVKAGVEALIWNEAERLDDPDELKDTLAELLDSEIQDPETFLAESLDAHIDRIAECLGLPSPLAGEGVGRSPTDEGSHAASRSPSSAGPDSPAEPLIRAAGAAHLLPQGEKGPPIPDHPFRSSG